MTTFAHDPWADLPTGAPANRRERLRAATHITVLGLLVMLVVLAVVFDQFAATGVLLITFLSFILTYLIAPAVEEVRRLSAVPRKGRPVRRTVAVLAIYGGLAAVALPLWVFTGERVMSNAERMSVLVPEHVARFIGQLQASERWTDTAPFPPAIRDPLANLTRRVSRNVQDEVRELGVEVAGVSRLIPWLSTVPMVAFLLLTRWSAFRRSTTRVLPTPHLQWRGDEFLRHLNSLLAAYTRAQATSALIIGVLCWIGFWLMRLPYPGALGFVAGLLEMIPLAGPITMAIIATAMAPDRVIPILLFLAGLRVLQDYAIYPRLISQAMHLHPLAVVFALWAGAALGGLIGVCLAIPLVGVAQVILRHWREYRDIEELVAAPRQGGP